MKNDVMLAAIRKRKGRNFDAKGFLDPEPGLDSDDLKAKTEVTMGQGVREESMRDHGHSHTSSTDDLSPSDEEMKNFGVDPDMEDDEDHEEDDITSHESEDDYDLDDDPEEVDDDRPETGGDHDSEVYDPDMIRKIKARGGPKTLMERMQWDLYKKRKR